MTLNSDLDKLYSPSQWSSQSDLNHIVDRHFGRNQKSENYFLKKNNI
jgi:hypothetical protein